VLEGGLIKVTEKISSLVIPDSLQEIILSRIDKLDEESRNLLKMASVIGRYFDFRILQEILATEKDMALIIEMLVSNQLFLLHKMGETADYGFKHALIHEAVYITIPVSIRKQIHLKVGKAMEKIFQERLPDHYGILAYHYSLGEDPDRAEEYLLKAGERALRSSASFEALYYFREALSTYLVRHGSEADPAKLALLYKNIGYAHFNTGHFIETAEYLEKVLNFHGIKIPTNPLLLYPKVFYGLFIFLIRIRFTSLMTRKTATDIDLEINELILKKGDAFSITDSMQLLLETLYHAPRLTRYRQNEFYVLYHFMMIFSFGGLSLKVSERIGIYASKILDQNEDLYDTGYTNTSLFTFHNLMVGKWKDLFYEERVVEKGISKGDLYYLTTYLGMQMHVFTERGDRFAGKLLERIGELADGLEYDYARLATYSHGSLYCIKFREFEKALEIADEGLKWVRDKLGNKPGQIMIYALKIKALVKAGKMTEAEECLVEVNELIRGEKLVPYFLSFYLSARLQVTVHQLEEAIKAKDRKKQSRLHQEIKKTSRKSLRILPKVAFERVEVYRLLGIYYWLSKKEGKALKWWNKAIRESELLGAKVEQAQCLEDIARRLNEAGSHPKEFIGESIESLQKRSNQILRELGVNI